MKHKFLLDENILYFAVKGVNTSGAPDCTATDLVDRIGSNCHRMVIDPELAGRYAKHLQTLESVRPPAMEPSRFLNEFLLNSAKAFLEPYKPAQIPQGVKVPHEDIHIVRLAVQSGALVVTEDIPLREAINTQPVLGLQALTSEQALVLAHEE